MPRRTLPVIGLTLCLLILSAALAEAQNMYVPYYGKNRVLYEKFPWKIYPTEHFQIYFYTTDDRLLKNVADFAESAYAKVSRELKHDLGKPVPLLYYTTFTDFEQSNVFQVSEGVLGVSEPVMFRVGIHGDMTEDELQALISHELAHIFQFDLLWGDKGGVLSMITQPPLWTFEGLSEYVTGEWSSWSTLITRDAVLNDRIPDFSDSGELFSRYPLPREPAYDFGHALYEFMVERYGAGAIRDLWRGLKSTPLLGRRDPIERTFKLKTREFSQEFKRYLRARFKDFYTRENPEDYSIALGPEFPINPYYFAFSQALSPSGDLVATITFNALEGDIDIVLLSTKDGRVLRNITKGFTIKYESIKFEIDPSYGTSLAWSRDGNELAFFGRKGRRHSLFIVSALTGATLREIDVKQDQPAGPSFFPDGKKILFSAYEKGRRDIFAVDLVTGTSENLTQNDLFEKAPTISPDGLRVAYSIRVGRTDKIFLSPLSNLNERRQITFGPDQNVCPSFSLDGDTIFYAGNAREAYNVYSVRVSTGDVRRYTDVRTGNFFPTPLPNEPGKIIFSSFNKGAFQLFKSDTPGSVEPPQPAHPEPAEPETFTPTLSFPLQKDKIQTHKGLGKLILASAPPIDAMITTDGAIWGGSSLAFSDMLGDHTFTMTAYQVREFRSFNFSYLNLRNRFPFLLSAFQYTIYYYPYSTYFDPSAMFRQTTRDAIATRKITGLTALGQYPFDKFTRAEASLGFYNFEEDSSSGSGSGNFDPRNGYFINGTSLQASFSLVGETTLFRAPYGPFAGHTFRLSLSQTIPVSESFIHSTTVEADLRKYFYLGSDFTIAFRGEGSLSLGRDRYLSYYGGNNQVRSTDFYSLVATEYWFINAEFRFPVIHAIDTLIGSLGPVRGTIFFDITRNRLGSYPAKFYEVNPDFATTGGSYYRELEAIGSYGIGFQFYFLGLPIHLDYAKRLEWVKLSKPFSIKENGEFVLRFWIGYDF